ncbi:hypothetical protein HMPREF9127_1242 [Parvimonas sp. oral taxon 393 str. F0440]|nr:hypothetical protein HMPREF9127_1242 [Parvimonas sp. oral taxon 393 str. F0440]
MIFYNLHYSMFLFKPRSVEEAREIIINLHYSMFLFKPIATL